MTVTMRDVDPVDIHDRVAEAYYGRFGNSDFTRLTRRRVHWICANVRGGRVLDVGCSQGIAAILLGREGKKVTGIDLAERSIAEANDYIAAEPEIVRENVTFIADDFLSHDFGTEVFDTVILGEVLEHLLQPDAFVAAAVDLLAENGRLIVTVPFGINDWPDHKQTFYLLEPYRLLSRRLAVTDVMMFGKWLGLIGDRVADEEANHHSDILPTQLIGKLEAAFYDVERVLTDARQGLNAKLERVRVRKREQAREIRALEANVARLQEECVGASQSSKRVQAECRELKESLEQTQAAYAKLKQSFSETVQSLGAELKSLKAERMKLTGDLHRAREVKRQLPYRLGKVLVEHAKRPVQWPLLPLRLYQAFRSYRKDTLKEQAGAHLDRHESRSRCEEVQVSAEFPAFQPLTAPKVRIAVAAIVDELTEKCFGYEWDLILLTVKCWRAEIEKAKPAFLFVESAWQGNGGEWSNVLTQFAQRPDNPLRDLLAWCQEVGLPTIFWSNEDPRNFDKFKDVAKEFDWVFTTDVNCVPKYREFCGHDRIFALPFAAQPALHNPAGRRENPHREIAFAGSWCVEKPRARQKYLPALLDAAIELDLSLSVFDRFSDPGPEARGQHIFPEKYTPYLRPTLSNEQMLSGYRMFPIFLSVNSGADSATMFSRRVFESLACGTNVVSSPSLGIEMLLPGLVSIAADKDQAVKALKELRADPAAARRRAHLGYRTVMREHTCSARAAQVVSTVLPRSACQARKPLITVVLTTDRPERLTHALENYRRQRYDNKQLILALNSDDFSADQVRAAIANIRDVRVFQIPETKTLAACLNHVLHHADGEFWAKFDDDDIYGAEYLSDSILPFQYTEAAIVGKATFFAQLEGDDALYLRHLRRGNEHSYVRMVCGGTLVVRRGVMEKLQFDESIPRGADTDFLKRAQKVSVKIYSADPYNFIQVRRADPTTHTWRIARETYLRSCQKVADKYRSDLVFF